MVAEQRVLMVLFMRLVVRRHPAGAPIGQEGAVKFALLFSQSDLQDVLQARGKVFGETAVVASLEHRKARK